MNNFTQTVTTACGNFNKKLVSAVLLMLMLFVGNLSFGQTYYNMASGDYNETFTSWSTPATGVNWSSLAANTGTIPTATVTTLQSTSFVTTTVGGLQNGNTNIQFLSTGNTNNSNSVAFDLNLNFTGRNAGFLSFNAAQVTNGTGDRGASLKVYYSTNGATWTELTATNLPFNVVNGTASSAAVNIALPSALNNQSTVKLRFYNHNGPTLGTTGNRPKISIDDVVVTSTGAYTNTGATIVNGGVNFVGQPQNPTAYAQPTNCTAGDYRVLNYRKVSTTANNTTDGRGQWFTTVLAQGAGGNAFAGNYGGGSNNGFLFTSGGGCGATGNFNDKWNFGSAVQATPNAVNGTTLNSTTDMGLNMSTAGYYTFSMKDVYNTNGPAFYVGYTTYPPVNIVSTTQTAVCSTTATVTATLSAAPSSQETFYLRYRVTTNDFTASTLQVLGTVSGNTVTFNLTGLTNANTYFYYILSTTHATYTSLSEVDKTLSCLKYLDNSGNNYSFTTSASAPTITTQPSNSTSSVGGSTTYTVAATNAATYQWQYATTVGGTYANVVNATPTGTTYSGTTSATLTVTTTTTAIGSAYFYRCVVTSACSTSLNSNGAQMIVYCAATGNNTYSTGTTLVNYAGINNATPTKTAGYNNYTAQNAVVTAGAANNITINVNSGGNFTVFTRVYIDWDQNGVFNTTTGSAGGSGETYLLGSAVNVTNGVTSLSPLSITVPSGAALGITRMRVVTIFGSGGTDPFTTTSMCLASTDAEVEDYTVTVAAGCTQPATQATIGAYTANTTGTSLTVNWTRGNGTGGVIVVARATATANQIPLGGTTYTPSTVGAFGGTTTTGTGNIVIYNGTGTSVNVTGLTAGTSYTFNVYEYNTTSACYLTPASASAVTTCTTGTPSVSIAVTTGANPTCASTSVTFTATPTNGGTPSYQWKLNGTNVGTSIATYTNAALVNGDQVSCVLTNAAACTTTATSNTITMTVTAAPTTSNAGTGQSICVGAGAVTLAANAPTVGTGTWSVSGPSTLTSQFSNVNSPTASFTPAGGAGSYVLTWSIANAPCTASTSTVTITVSAAPSPITISPTAPTVCSGNIVSLTPFPSSSNVAATAVAASSGTVSVTGNPLRTSWGANRMQVIYTAAELTNAGLVAGSAISGIAFNVTTSSTETRTAFNIGYKYTSLSSFPGLTYETGIINVYSTALAATSLGANTYNFTTPSATWNGTDNVIFEFCFSDNVIGVINTVVSALPVTTGNTVIQAAADSTTTQCSLATATTTGTTRPYILLQSIKPSVVWSPTTELFTNAAGTVAYTGAATTVVYAKPTATRTYTATTTANGCSASNTVVVTVATTPTVTATTPSAVCNSGTVTLGATGSAGTTLNWYAAATGGTSLATGTSFTTPSISTTTPYYVQADINNTTGIGVISESGTLGNFTIATGMYFSSANASTINSIDVYPGTAGTLNITMKDNTGTVRATQAFTIVAGDISTTVKKTLTLTGFTVPAGSTGWTLNYDIGLNRGASFYTFPYTTNGFSITGNGVNGNNISIGTRMYFYNWNVTTNSCSSARTLVNATVNPTPTTANAGPDQSVCSTNTITLAANTATSGTGAWSIISGSGGTVTTPSSPTSTFTGTAGTTYTLRWTISSGVCTASTDDVVITIFSPLDFVNLQFPGSATICQGTSLTAFGQVYEPGVTPGAGTQGPNITVEFGYDGANTNPSTWTNWATASFNSTGGGTNNDEYQYVFTPSSTGTYYYAFRYKQGTCDTWQYGGYSGSGGGTWGGSNVNGVLTVNSNAAHTIALSSGSSTPALCQNTLLGTNIVYAIGGGATGAGVTGLPSGMSGSFSSGTFTISGTPTTGGTYNYTVTTTGNGCATALTATGTITVSSTLDFVNLQFPASGTICQTSTFTAYGQVFEPGVTQGAGQGAGITVEFGYNGTNSNPSTWTNWFAASYNPTVTGNNDEYLYTLSPPSSGTFYYAYRYKQGTCDWQYGGYTSGGGGTWGGSNVSGVLTVNPTLTASVSIAASATTICSGTSVTFTATPTNGGASPSYQWYVGATPVGTNSATFTSSTLTNGNSVSVVMTSNATPCLAGSPATSNSISITVNPILTASVSIAASATTICSGTSVTFTATPTNGGATPSYQWYVGATPVGTDSATYTTTSLANADSVSVVLTSNATPCLAGSPATSNSISITVNPILTASVSISASATTICAGTSVTFTATPTNGGSTPSYQWYVGATPVGTDSATFTTSTLTNGNSVSVVMTSNATPCLTGSPATSNSISITVNPILTASVSIAASATTICSGTSVTFTATPTNGGATPSYQWYVGATPVGTDSATYTTTSLANADSVSVVLTSNATPCLTGSPATSNSISITVNPILTASVSIAASATTICSGTSVTFTATPTNGGSAPSYQWYVGATPVGTDSATYTTTSLANADSVSVVLTSNATPCLTGSPATSNSISITVNPTLTASVSIAASATTICAGTSVTFTAAPTNGGSTPSYQWYVGATPVGTNSATFTSSTLTNGNSVSVVMTSNATPCLTGSPATSNSISITVNPILTASVSIAASATTICAGTSVTFTATPTNGGSTPSYQWYVGATPVGTDSATYTTTSLANADSVSVVLTSNATPCLTGSPATSNSISITVNPTLTASVSIAASATTICAGTSVTFTATPTNDGATPSYQWYVGATPVGTDSATYTTTLLANADSVSVVLTSNATPCLAGSPATSNSISITVNPILTASVSIAASATTICAGTSVTFTATPTNGGATPSYQWYVGATPVGTDSATYTTTSLANADSVSVVLTSNATPCLTGSPATSNSISITVNPSVTASVSIAASATTICAGTSVTFTATPTNGGSTPSYQWYVGATPVGTDSATYTTTTLANADSVSVVLTSNATPCLAGSPATSNSISITVNPNTTPTFTPVGTICAGSPLSALPTTSNNGITGTWSPALDNTTTTVYTFTPTAGQCATTATLTITVGGTVTWNGTAWDNVTGPTSTNTAIFAGNYTIGADFNACSIQVNSGAVVSVTSGFNVNLYSSITVASGGSFTLNNNANLYQANASAVNTGNVVVKRNSNPLIRLDYTIWSSPVTGQGILAFSPLTSISPTIRFYTYNTSSNLFSSVASPSTTNFATGTGYLIRLPFNHPTAPAVWAGSFTGVPNNGTKTIGLTNIDEAHQFNAVGNPYPSPISISQFVTDNAGLIEPTLYFWRKTNNTNSPSYCTWNTTSGTFGDNGEAYTNTPNGVIQTGQGFIVEAKGNANTLTFNNGQRTVNNANQFFKSSTATATTDEAHRIWLNLTGTGAEFSQAVVGYFTNATLGSDDYDSKYFNDGAVALNMKIAGTDYVIQGRPAPFDATDVVPLNYKVTTAGTYNFTLDHVDGLFTGGAQNIYIKDNLDATYHNITSGTYSFTSAAGTFADRFELVYTDSALNTDNHNFDSNSIVVYHQQNDVVINTGAASMATVRIFDIRGRLLVEKKDINSSETRINVGTTNQVLVVQVTTTDGLKATKKVIN
jgi:hypothetical protein